MKNKTTRPMRKNLMSHILLESESLGFLDWDTKRKLKRPPLKTSFSLQIRAR
jgi:hypothetical protein